MRGRDLQSVARHRFVRVAALLLAAGCGGKLVMVCTLLGCSDGVLVMFSSPPPAGATVEISDPDTPGSLRSYSCETSQQCGYGAWFTDYSASKAVITVRIGAASRTTVVSDVRYVDGYPNGPDCPAACRSARIEVPLP